MDDVEASQRFASARDTSDEADGSVPVLACGNNLVNQHLGRIVQVVSVAMPNLAYVVPLIDVYSRLNNRRHSTVAGVQPLLRYNGIVLRYSVGVSNFDKSIHRLEPLVLIKSATPGSSVSMAGSAIGSVVASVAHKIGTILRPADPA